MSDWTAGSGRICLAIPLDRAEECSHPGQCDADVERLSLDPDISEQLDNIDPAVLRDELDEYGAWDENELQDHRANLLRLLWIACNDIVEEDL